MGRPITCSCGDCGKCRRRVYMRAYYHRAREGRFSSGGPVSLTCEFCGSPFESTVRKLRGHGHRYCSWSCKDQARKEADKRARLESKPTRTCPHCGGDVPKTRRADALFCSATCENAAHNATRKARWKTGNPVRYVSRAEIIARDESQCRHCGKVCDMNEIHLDHLVPLARGGTHDADNIVVACARCNLSRGARPLAAQ